MTWTMHVVVARMRRGEWDDDVVVGGGGRKDAVEWGEVARSERAAASVSFVDGDVDGESERVVGDGDPR